MELTSDVSKLSGARLEIETKLYESSESDGDDGDVEMEMDEPEVPSDVSETEVESYDDMSETDESDSESENETDESELRALNLEDKCEGTEDSDGYEGYTEREALLAIRSEQRRTANIIDPEAFKLLAYEILQDFTSTKSFSQSALDALQTAAEDYLIDQLDNANLQAIHAGREKITVRDMHMVCLVRDVKLQPARVDPCYIENWPSYLPREM